MVIDLRASTDPEIAALAHVLARIDRAAADAGVAYLVVGATALSLPGRRHRSGPARWFAVARAVRDGMRDGWG